MIAAAVALWVVAVALSVRGLVGRRVGDELRCKRCEYNLTGIESVHCPECGLSLIAGMVRKGVRKRRRGSLAAGAVVLVAAGVLTGGVAAGWIDRTNLYQYL